MDSNVILITHAELYRGTSGQGGADPWHIESGVEKINKTVSLVVQFMQGDGLTPSPPLKAIFVGEAAKFKDICVAIKKQTVSLYPDILVAGSDWLGTTVSARSKLGMYVSVTGNYYSRFDSMREALDVAAHWNYVAELAKEFPDGYVLLCSGRPMMRGLGLGSQFVMGSAYVLDWRAKKAERIVVNGKLPRKKKAS